MSYSNYFTLITIKILVRANMRIYKLLQNINLRVHYRTYKFHSFGKQEITLCYENLISEDQLHVSKLPLHFEMLNVVLIVTKYY